MWFLTGEARVVALPDDTRRAAAAYVLGEARVVSGLAHGWRPAGARSFSDDCLALLRDALADWR